LLLRFNDFLEGVGAKDEFGRWFGRMKVWSLIERGAIGHASFYVLEVIK